MKQWICPRCKRRFKTANQSHSCSQKDIGELFIGRSDELVLLFDKIYQHTVRWEPNSVGAATNSIVFSNRKAWLIVKPMKHCLDVKFYFHEVIESDRIHKTTSYFGKFAHHIRVYDEGQVDTHFFDLIRQGYEYALD